MDPVEGQGPAAAVVEPQPAAPVQPVPDGQDAFNPETHIRVPKADLGDYDGRWSGVMGDAHRFKAAEQGGLFEPGVKEFVELARQNGMSPQEAYDYMTGTGQPPQQQQYDTPGQPGQPQGQQPPEALTVDRYTQLREKERADDKAAREAESDQANLSQRFSEETEDVTRVLRDDFKYTFTEDGLPADSIATHAKGMYNAALNKVMKEDVPDWLPREEKAEALRTIGSTPSTPAQRQRAKDIFTADMEAFKQHVLGNFAKGQEGVHATLGAGPGGPVTKDPSKRTYQEDVAALAEAVKQRTGKGMDGEPV